MRSLNNILLTTQSLSFSERQRGLSENAFTSFVLIERRNLWDELKNNTINFYVSIHDELFVKFPSLDGTVFCSDIRVDNVVEHILLRSGIAYNKLFLSECFMMISFRTMLENYMELNADEPNKITDVIPSILKLTHGNNWRLVLNAMIGIASKR